MFEKVLKFVNKVSFIRKKFILFAAFFVIAGFYGCDVCDLGESKDKDANDIFFSAVSLNGTIPGIYAVSPDGSKLREIIKDGVLYSGPSRNKMIVFLREIIGEDTVICTVKTNSDSLFIDTTISNQYDLIEMPVISPDGKYVSIYVGSGQLIIIANMSFAREATFEFYEGTEPSFSPDGRFLAFYETDGLFGPIRMKVVRTDDPNIIIYERSFEQLLFPMIGNATIDWSDDSRFLTYAVKDTGSSSDIIIIDEINGNSDNELKISGIGAKMPSLSPDKTKVVFASRDGNIWVRTIEDGKYRNMTEETDTTIEFNLYPLWTNDGNWIFFTKYYRDDTGRFGGTLKIVNYFQPKRKMVLSNGVLRGYKMRIKA
ncbi:MAG: hypothetical protein A2X61_08740 [Ignavibacteria bacterium GWB2_35_12]|nr:MAG: hypothetical protein A2X63_08115 [Ignavibacteria bacterium GWA2_35_8]OGU40708.1 MAG: hypothetical protein A2X61_08740 [Ignavibacteria bacterium GWB2_35_12]OGU97289.1 MAG: hypothetical protein A2220_07515 [Ignavibacteria bacterium RIFOXYA2_FULL_35_10]OGV22386.1 MAG: hypothetical protein A2475_15875 [Ignavibacteria bacterium RIFOXYC2_FULL_35_21]